MKRWVCLALLLTGCLPDGALKTPEEWVPEPVANDWEVATAEEVGLDPSSVEAAVRKFQEDGYMPLGRSLLVVREGRLVAETYVRPEWGRDDLQYVKSVTKSVTSLGVGIALSDGAIESVSDPVLPLVGATSTGHDPTFADFLSMRAGLRWDNEVTNREFLVDLPADSVAYTLEQGFDPPGGRFAYNDGEPHLVGAAIAQAVGRPFDEYVAERLFAPLGIERWDWYRHPDGVAYSAFGLWLRPRDMAKLGQLVVTDGVWDGAEVVTASWIAESTTERVANDTDDAPVFARGYPYGYYWWLESSRGAVIARGHGGQTIYVVPEERLVVVITAAPFSSFEAWVSSGEVDSLVDLILDGSN